MSLNLKPLGDRVIVEPVETDVETFAGGALVLPETAKEKPQRGKIIAAGPGKMGEDGKRTPLDVKAGDRVLFGKYAGTEIKLDGVEHVFMKEDDILSIVE